ncbi:hypothetical protein BD413DRAFT_444022, partial [Trametes elegans]
VRDLSTSSHDGRTASPGPSNPNRGPLPAEGSAVLDVPHALDDLSRTQLHVAIATALEQRVREAFAALVHSVPAVTEHVFGMLPAMPIRVAPRAHTPPAPPPVRVVLIPRWAICENCGEEHVMGDERDATECGYQPGYLEVNYEAFVDWDEDTHGPMDTPSNRREYPDNFTWSCCDCDGTEPDCVVGEHEPSKGRPRPKRAR